MKRLLVDLAEHITGLEHEISDLRDQLDQQQQQTALISLKKPSKANLTFDASPLQVASSAPPGSYLDSDFHAIEGLTEHLRRLSFANTSDRHFGGSSSIMLVKSTIDIKNEYNGDGSDVEFSLPVPHKRPDFWTIHPVELWSFRNSKPKANHLYSGKFSHRMTLRPSSFRILTFLSL